MMATRMGLAGSVLRGVTWIAMAAWPLAAQDLPDARRKLPDARRTLSPAQRELSDADPAARQHDFSKAVAVSLDRLSSRRFGDRQAATEHLANEGSAVVTLVEQSAREGDLDHACRCVQILTRLASRAETKQIALAALDRLATEEGTGVSRLAGRRAFELRETATERAIRLLAASGVKVHIDAENRVRFVSNVTLDRHCRYLRYLPGVQSVSLSGGGVSDACLAELARLPQLSSLSIMRTSISDAGLGKLRDLDALQRVTLSGDYSVWGLRHLSKVERLSSVALFDPVGDAELASLLDLPLRSLYLSRIKMTPVVAELLARTDRVESLSLTLIGVTDDDLQWVANTSFKALNLSIDASPRLTNEAISCLKVPSLNRLSLSRTGITGEGLSEIAEIDSLTSLSISKMAIDDKDILQLSSLRRLRSLTFRDTRVTDEGLSALSDSMTHLRYVRNDSTKIAAN